MPNKYQVSSGSDLLTKGKEILEMDKGKYNVAEINHIPYLTQLLILFDNFKYL